MSFVYLVLGFVLLIKGADWLVGSASKLAKSFGVSSLIIGLSVVAFGTSAPESAIGILSGIKHTNQITLGDVVGSSIANIALIIGVTALLSPLTVEESLLKKELPMSFGIQVLFLGLAAIGGIISRVDGIILLLAFLLFLFYLWSSVKQSSRENDGENGAQNEEDPNQINEDVNMKYRLRLFLIFGVGLACLILGGNFVVDSSVSIAHAFGLSEALIGVTIVALGTSLPELVTCVVAAIRKESDIAIGNIIGSNIFNILFVMGLSSVINPIGMTGGIYWDVLFMLVSTLLLFGLTIFPKKVTRLGGVVLGAFYIAFIVYKVLTI